MQDMTIVVAKGSEGQARPMQTFTHNYPHGGTVPCPKQQRQHIIQVHWEAHQFTLKATEELTRFEVQQEADIQAFDLRLKQTRVAEQALVDKRMEVFDAGALANRNAFTAAAHAVLLALKMDMAQRRMVFDQLHTATPMKLNSGPPVVYASASPLVPDHTIRTVKRHADAAELAIECQSLGAGAMAKVQHAVRKFDPRFFSLE